MANGWMTSHGHYYVSPTPLSPTDRSIPLRPDGDYWWDHTSNQWRAATIFAYKGLLSNGITVQPDRQSVDKRFHLSLQDISAIVGVIAVIAAPVFNAYSRVSEKLAAHEKVILELQTSLNKIQDEVHVSITRK